jgi:hypothetical protein
MDSIDFMNGQNPIYGTVWTELTLFFPIENNIMHPLVEGSSPAALIQKQPGFARLFLYRI